MATRWRMPPESSWGRWSYERSRWTRRQELLRPSLAVSARHPAEPQRELDVACPAVSHGKSAASWNISVGSPDGLDGAGGLGVEAAR